MKYIVLALTFGLNSVSHSQIEPEQFKACQDKFLIYQNGDSVVIKQNWKLNKDENFNYSHLKRMQNDVYGQLSDAKRREITASYNLSYKTTALTTVYDSILSKDRQAKFHLKLSNSKRKKEVYLIESCYYTSRSESATPFVDSLCTPFIELIQNKQVDSLTEMLFPKEKMDALLKKMDEIKSKKKREEIMMGLGFYQMSTQFIIEKLTAIDETVPSTYSQNKLVLEKFVPTLSVTYLFFSKENEPIHLTLRFVIEKNDYKMIGISVSEQSDRQKI